MSLLNITPSDFGKGKFELHSGMYETQKIQQYIDKYEKRYLVQLLGSDLYNLFAADVVAGVPVDPIYLDLFNAFEYDDTLCDIVISEGMLEMLKGFVYFEYSKDLTNQMTVNGNVGPSGQNSVRISTINQQIYTRYNEAVRTFKSIQRYICDNQSTYLEYNGVKKRFVYWI